MTQRVVAHNVKARANAGVVGHLLDLADDPESAVIIAMETQGGRKNIGGRRVLTFMRLAVKALWHVVVGEGIVGASTQMYVRPGVRVISSGVGHVATRWRGPKSAWRNQRGRSFPWSVALLNGRWTLVIGAHLPWGPHIRKNRAAWRDCALWLRRMADAYPNADVLIVGDLNVSPNDNVEYGMRWLAREIGGVIILGSGIDYAVFRGATNPDVPKRPKAPTGQRLGLYGSDHPAIAINL